MTDKRNLLLIFLKDDFLPLVSSRGPLIYDLLKTVTQTLSNYQSFSDLGMHQNPLRLVQSQVCWAPPTPVSESVNLRWDLRVAVLTNYR